MMKNGDHGISKIKSIQDYVQSLADTFAQTLDFEVAIVDEHLEVIAGTGKYREHIGVVYGKSSFNNKLMDTQKSCLVSETLKCRICQQCEFRNSCKVLAGLLSPIKLNGKTIGSISIYAFDDKQKDRLLSSKTKLKKFMENLGDLIASKLNEVLLNEQLTNMAEQIKTLIDSVRQGIVATNYKGVITHINRSAEMILAVQAEQLIGHQFDDTFSGIDMAKLRNLTETHIDQDIYYKKGEHIIHLMSTITSFGLKYLNNYQNDTGEGGFVISFRTINDMRKLAGHLIKKEGTCSLDDILGTSKPITELKKKVRMVSTTDSTILITGESGTGKELFARAIHQESLRKNGPFVAVNCGAIPENLLESEMFGYEGGAFTGARQSGKPGKFELANGGTLFLDEIGDMPLHLQVKLLRFLQEYKIEKVGGVKPIFVDVRIIAATNRNLEEMIQYGQFRCDLFYRLSVIPVHIPPLRERREDLTLLINHFLRKYNLLLNKSIKGFSDESMSVLLQYPWPGNVRELENAMEYSTNICQDTLIGVNSLPERITKHFENVNLAHKQEQIQSIRDLEKKALIEALNTFGSGSRAKEKAARSLGMSRSTIYRKIKELGIAD